MHKIILLGPPGVGKGTQGKLISRHLNVPHLSTGDMLRDEMQRKSILGLEITEVMNSGNYVNDDLINDLVISQIQEYPDGFILDGYPRTLTQAKFLSENNGDDFTVLLFDAPDSVLIERMLARNRKSETLNIITHRLAVYTENANPIIDYYTELETVVCIDSTQSVYEIFKQSIASLE